MHRIAILAEGAFGWHYGKTATGVIRYSQDTTVAVIDSTKAGQDVAHALQGPIGEGIPVVKDINAALEYHPDTLLIGIAPRGGQLPPEWRWQLLTAIEHKLNIVSGLHMFLADDPELGEAAQANGVRIWDVRRPPKHTRVAEYIPHRAGSHTVLLVGSDCGAGKMTCALEADQEARRRGWNSTFLATGQTGIMISNNGLPVDRLIVDFAAGLVEEQVLELTEKHDWLFVEGQGAINHPGYSPVTLSLIHGSQPDALIFCHKVGQQAIEGYDTCPFPPLRSLIEANENIVNLIKSGRPSKVVGLSLITNHLNDSEAREAIEQIEQETGLPATDTFRYGVGKLVDALDGYFAE